MAATNTSEIHIAGRCSLTSPDTVKADEENFKAMDIEDGPSTAETMSKERDQTMSECKNENEEEARTICCLARVSENKNLFQAEKIYNVAFTKYAFKPAEERRKIVKNKIIEKKVSILHEVSSVKQNTVFDKTQAGYNELIRSIDKPASLDKTCEKLLNNALECENEETGEAMFRILLDLKQIFIDQLGGDVDDNQRNCAWDEDKVEQLKKITELQLRYEEVPFVSPHSTATYLPFKMSFIKRINTKYAEHYAKLGQKKSVSKFKIKVGYVSSDFKNHPMSHLINGLFSKHDRRSFEVYLYALNEHDGSYFRERIEIDADHFRDVSKMDFEERNIYIKNDGIHILINLNGYTNGIDNMLFSRKPAPVQVMWLGFPGTSGAAYMDYIITDPVSTPLVYAEDFTEKLAFMPPTHFVGDHMHMFAHLVEKMEVRLSSRDDILCSIIVNGRDLQPFRDACKNAGFIIAGSKEHGESIVIPYIYILPVTSSSIWCQLVDKLPHSITCSLQALWNLVDMLPHSITWNLVRNDLKLAEKLTIFGVDILNGLYIGKDAEQIKWKTGEVVPESLIFTCRYQYGLPDDKVVYANFCQNYKYDKVAIKMWAQVLSEVPNSVLWLLRFNESAEENVRGHIKEIEKDIEQDRIIFSDPVEKEEYIRRAQLADVFLDTPLCNAHTTGMDAIFAGVPLVTLPGRKLAARIAASLVTELGCEKLIARNEEKYVNIAVKLGKNSVFLRNIKDKVFTGRSKSSLFDVSAKVASLEELYELMFHQMYEEPQHITELVRNELKAVPARKNITQQQLVTNQFASERLLLEKPWSLKNWTIRQTFAELPKIPEEHEPDEDDSNGNIPFLDDILEQ